MLHRYHKKNKCFLLIPAKCELMNLAAICGSGELPHTAAAAVHEVLVKCRDTIAKTFGQVESRLPAPSRDR